MWDVCQVLSYIIRDLFIAIPVIVLILNSDTTKGILIVNFSLVITYCMQCMTNYAAKSRNTNILHVIASMEQ